MNYAGRQTKLRAALGASRVDALLVSHLPNIHYLCGFTGSAGVLVIRREDRGAKATFYTDGRYTQQATTSVLVTDGGTVVIGGVIQTQNSLAINQIPVLGSLPILGHLFRHTAVNTSTQELIFFITPKIIQT